MGVGSCFPETGRQVVELPLEVAWPGGTVHIYPISPQQRRFGRAGWLTMIMSFFLSEESTSG
jgi:hypothetical protein